MQSGKIEWGIEVVQLASEVADVSGSIGVPGLGLIGKFAQKFYNYHLIKRFNDFCKNAEIDQDLIKKIQEDETYSNCFYSVLETVRRRVRPPLNTLKNPAFFCSTRVFDRYGSSQ